MEISVKEFEPPPPRLLLGTREYPSFFYISADKKIILTGENFFFAFENFLRDKFYAWVQIILVLAKLIFANLTQNYVQQKFIPQITSSHNATAN